MRILHIDCSPRPASDSYSRKLSAAIVDKLATLIPDPEIRRRDLGHDPIPHIGAKYASILATPASLAAASSSDEPLHLSERLIQEVEDADIVVIGTPMNNFTIPSVLKAWIDHVLRVGRTIDARSGGKVGMLRDRPVFVAVASGGVFTGDEARQPDLLTSYLSAALGCIGLETVHYLPLQATAFSDEAQLATMHRSLIETVAPALSGWKPANASI